MAGVRESFSFRGLRGIQSVATPNLLPLLQEESAQSAASGYNLCTEEGYRTTFDAFESLIGFERLKVFHLNDSKKPCMSRVDRHEHIGKGCIGLEPFRRLLNDPRFDHLPMILETEKSEWREKGKVVIDPLDEMNLNTLRSLLKHLNRRSEDVGEFPFKRSLLTF